MKYGSTPGKAVLTLILCLAKVMPLSKVSRILKTCFHRQETA